MWVQTPPAFLHRLYTWPGIQKTLWFHIIILTAWILHSQSPALGNNIWKSLWQGNVSHAAVNSLQILLYSVLCKCEWTKWWQHEWTPHDWIIFSVSWGSWYDHVKGYWKETQNKKILYIFFEDMKEVNLLPTKHIHVTYYFLEKAGVFE